MRKCPKCGAEYADTDFRTLCSYCMVSLKEASAATPVAGTPAGPIQVGGPESAQSAPAPIIPATIAMPEVTIPEMAMPAPPASVEIAEPDAPAEILPQRDTEVEPALEIVLEPEPEQEPEVARRPGPYRRPLTPQPNPAVPQPPIIPEPEPNPETEPAVPVPVPAPRPAPQPTPEPQPAEPVPSARVGEALKPDELASSRSAFGAYLFFGFLSGTVCLLLLPNLDRPFTLLLLAGLGWLTYYLLRQALYRGAIGAVKVAPLRRLELGETAPLEAVVSVVRDLAVTDVEITLTGQERAVRGEGKNATTHRHTFYEKTVRIPAPAAWAGGHRMVLKAGVPLPDAAPPSFSGRKNHIEWSARLWVGITGAPDVRERIPLTVVPCRKGTLPPNAQPVYNLPELGPLNAQIGFTCPLSVNNLPVFEIGKAIPFSLRMQPEGDFAQQRVFVELMYLISGSGDNENQVVARQSFPIAFWQGDPNHAEESLLTIPPGSPITYNGTHVRIHWAVAVRHEQPWGRDRRQVFEVLVVPANE